MESRGKQGAKEACIFRQRTATRELAGINEEWAAEEEEEEEEEEGGESKMPGGTSTRESSEAIRMEPLGRTSSSRSPGQNGTANTTTEVPINSGE